MQLDFDDVVNGEWYSSTEIPEGYARWGSFEILNKQTQSNLENLVKNASGRYRNLRIMYDSGMDVRRRDENGLASLIALATFITDINDIKDIAKYVADLKINGLPAIFGVLSSEDVMDSKMMRCIIGQGGLSLPDRSYYLDDDKEDILTKYVTFLHRIMSMIYEKTGVRMGNINDILFIERELASSHKTKTELRDPHSNYNKYTVSQLSDLAGNFDWQTYFETLGIRPEFVIVNSPSFFGKMNELLTAEHLEKWKTYLKMRIIINCASYTTMEMEKIVFDFYKGVLSGVKLQKPLNERIMMIIDDSLGFFLEELYVQKYFPGESKKAVEEMVSNLRKAFSNRISALDWMSDSTKRKAQSKLENMICKIGYPDKNSRGVNYGELPLTNNYLRNVILCSQIEIFRDLQKIDKPVDRNEWHMPAQTINAYYNPPMNEIVFPAGILQTPFYDHRRSLAENYGAIGSIIGHEMTHGFDDEGRKFSETGNLEDWWAPDDAIRFDSKTKEIDELYSRCIVSGNYVNGKLTLGENIADLGGVLIAMDAYKMAIMDDIDKVTPRDIEYMMKSFFEAYAKMWRCMATPEIQKKLLLTDPHAPSHLRINNVLCNVPLFHEVYKTGYNMSKITKIW